MIPLDRTKSLSEPQEDYLKQIYLLTEAVPLAGTQALADRLGVSPASVTVMLQKLGSMELVAYEQYKGVRLTESGRAAALEMLRHHRLLESFLHQALGYGWDEVHDEAEKLEHYISETFESRMAAWLGNPSHDPHGDPIPDSNLNLPPVGTQALLTDQESGFSGRIVRVGTQDRDELNLFRQLGMVPGADLTLVATADEGLRVRTGTEPYLLPRPLARKLWVERTAP
ncbi:MAG TPA: metal-dependent transcriptional regulator [Spirochaetia bacterium]|jgi:DtxR family Mn-dependent transcriptional regulator|nr:metal-dependent transcriptional regulator [Spirochaetia bacterium]